MNKISQLKDQLNELLAKPVAVSLATHSVKFEGYPFSSVTPFAMTVEGPVFLLSSMATHTRNLKSNPRATLLIAEISDNGNELASARASLVGDVDLVPEGEVEEVRKAYLLQKPEAGQWVDFGDFNFYRMNVIDAYVVAGFGVMGWVGSEEFP